MLIGETINAGFLEAPDIVQKPSLVLWGHVKSGLLECCEKPLQGFRVGRDRDVSVERWSRQAPGPSGKASHYGVVDP